MTPIFPNERLRMERPGGNSCNAYHGSVISPIGKGQRGMIVSPPKAGKTTLVKGCCKVYPEEQSGYASDHSSDR